MYSRVTLFELDPLRFDLGLAVERFRDTVLPELREQRGYEGVYVLMTPEGRGMALSLWASEEAAQAAVQSGVYAAQLDKFVTIFRAPPGREGYEVLVADAPAPAHG